MHFMKPGIIFKSSFFLRGIFVLSLAMLLYISAISYKHIRALTQSSELLVHSYKIQLQLEHVLSLMKEAEIAQRGYITTSDSVMLRPYKIAPGKIYDSYLRLKSLTIQNHEQQANLDTLHQLINYRFKLMALTLKSSEAIPFNETEFGITLFQGEHVMDDIKAQISKIDQQELQFLKNHQQTYEEEAMLSPVSTFLLLLFSLLVCILAFIKINRDLHVLKKSNEELLIINESIKHAEVIGDFYISQWNPATNKLIFSDNLYRLFGVEPQSFPATIENYLKYVHQEDKAAVAKSEERTFKDGNSEANYFRVIRKDGELRYFMSVGKFIQDESNRIYIGIGKDITEQHLSNVALEEQNRELEQSIKELESFNRVASHDLQEPLRKIQTFISRISEKDLANLSETGKEYLVKIESSAHRMRILIDDLLLFSRTNRSEEVFEKSDLNLVLENASFELAQNIEEKNAEIKSCTLPVLHVIPFQVQQLFVNLIGNALKYSRTGVKPLIEIDCEKLAAAHYPGFITDKRRKYYKITVSDNGMGFEQQYAEDIFLLFKRLHQKSDYPGSGIGLSICKKIAENHNGYIVAEGKPGVGATFSVFLPE
jgi:PAS domain S-box-containing protein